jgi:hypothetical protein
VSGYERIGLAKATSWKGPYGRVSEDAIFTGRQDDHRTFVEDPHIWTDHKGRGYKGLFHGTCLLVCPKLSVAALIDTLKF